jgi:predicted O-methyltransferase YrrM
MKGILRLFGLASNQRKQRTAENLEFFAELRRSTGGMLHAETYRRYCEIARFESSSNIIDVGVGRGASSISFALGIIASGRNATVHAVDQFCQNALGPHLYNMSANPDDCVALNLNEFERNLYRYGVSNAVRTWIGTTDEIAARLAEEIRADVLAIDADGHIDRDLGYFYDSVAPGGWIILDDYAERIDRNGRKRLAAAMSELSNEGIRDWVVSQALSKSRLLLGKQLLTFQLANFFERAGAIRKVAVMHKTAFYRKSSNQPFASLDLSPIREIEAQMHDRFVEEASRRTMAGVSVDGDAPPVGDGAS